MTNDDDYYKELLESIGIYGYPAFLIIGSHAADLAMVLSHLLEICSVDQLGESLTNKLSDLQGRFDLMFKTYRQDYLEKPDSKKVIFDKYRRNLIKFSTLVNELKEVLEELQQTEIGQTEEVSSWLDVMARTIKSVLGRFHKMRIEFPEE
ncbi:MAG: hypothetical protein WA821_13660 [Anaerolineales bacterium]